MILGIVVVASRDGTGVVYCPETGQAFAAVRLPKGARKEHVIATTGEVNGRAVWRRTRRRFSWSEPEQRDPECVRLAEIAKALGMPRREVTAIWHRFCAQLAELVSDADEEQRAQVLAEVIAYLRRGQRVAFADVDGADMRSRTAEIDWFGEW